MKTVRQLLEGKSRGLCTISPEARVFEALKLMAEKDIGALLVVENDKLVGVLSIGDLVKETISEQQFMIKQLESYIHR